MRGVGDECFSKFYFASWWPCAFGLIVTGFLERISEPFETFVEAIAGGGAGRLDILMPSVLDLKAWNRLMDVPRRVV